MDDSFFSNMKVVTILGVSLQSLEFDGQRDGDIFILFIKFDSFLLHMNEHGDFLSLWK